MADTEPESDADALRRLEERLDRAAAAAERLLGDAVAAASAGSGPPRPASGQRSDASGRGPADKGGDGDRGDVNGPGGEGGRGGANAPRGEGGRGGANGPPPVPPAGWQRPGSNGDPERRGSGELDLLLAVLASLRDRIPPELQQRLSEAVREVLLAVRALIDWYLERAERHRAEPAQVQDIPIL
jgi:hypothetical protein